MRTENKLVKEFNTNGPCVLNINEIVKSWEQRFTIIEDLYEDKYEFIKYLRKGSYCYDIKVAITTFHAKEIIEALGLVVTSSLGWEKKYNFYRKPDFNYLSMRRKPVSKQR